MNIKLTILLFIGLTLMTTAQERQLSSEAEISVLTIGPGALLNDSFGHSAFRVKDKLNYLDIVFNYGVFDFNEPNFYTKFAQGKLNYKLDINKSYSNFFESYIAQNRTIQEQVLNLTQNQKQQVFAFLVNNAKPENKNYLYDFFYDNCATKIKDVINQALDSAVTFNQIPAFSPKTFRHLIHDHVNKNSWGSFGIDVALGSVIDKNATAEEHMFLPKFIYPSFENASFSNSGKPLVKQSRFLYNKVDRPVSNSFFSSPIFVFGILGLIILTLTYFDYKKEKRNKALDLVLFTLTGIIGIVILLLWFATDHTATANNYNLLWAFPLNLFVIRQLFKKNVKQWFVKYLKFTIIMLCLLCLHWIIGVQVFAIGLIPLLIAIFIRYIYLVKYFSKSV